MGNDVLNITRRAILIRGWLAPFVTLILVSTTLVYFFAIYSRDRVEQELASIASNHRHMIDQFLAERASDLQFAASSSSFDEVSNQAHVPGLLKSLQSGSGAFLDLGVFDEKGHHVAYVGPYDLAGKNYADAEWFQEVRNKAIYISDVFLGYRNTPHFIIAVQRTEPDRIWYLRATIDTLFFHSLVESIRPGRTGEAYLVNRNGTFQTEPRSGGQLMKSDPDYTSYLVDSERIESFSARASSGERYLYATGLLKHTNWVLVVRQQASDAYAPLTQAITIGATVIIVGVTIAACLAYVLASGLAGRLTLADMETRRMKGELIVAGKLAEVGEMSAGLAHEINNPLQVMKSEQTMIEDLIGDLERAGTPPDPEVLRLLKDSAGQMDVQIQRCKRITNGLLKFARRDEPSVQPVNLHTFLPEITGMIERAAQLENISIVLDLDSDLPPIMADPNQLQQVFFNLLNNAVYALKGKQGGTIRIGTSHVDGYVAVSLGDNGCGIPPDEIEKVFMPFYTTKPTGQGTGLGLASAYGIIDGLGGEISLTSEQGAGTVFTVRLPVGSRENKKNAV